MPHKITRQSMAQPGIGFTCPVGGDIETDGDEMIVEAEVKSESIGRQQETVRGIPCPGCRTGFIVFDVGERMADGAVATHRERVEL